MNKKVTKKSAPKKVAKKVVKKPATKKAKSIKTVQAIRDGFKKPSKHNPLPYLRYLNTSISDVSNEKFPEMVQITAGPSKFSELFGRKYVNLAYAKLAVDTIHGDCIVDRSGAAIEAELLGIGILSVGENPMNDGGDAPIN
jgi:hypothetical protein